MKKPTSTWWIEKLNRSAFFFVALLLHLVVFLMVATWIIIQGKTPPSTGFDRVYVATNPTPPQPPPPNPDPSLPGAASSDSAHSESLPIPTSNPDAKLHFPPVSIDPSSIHLPANRVAKGPITPPDHDGLDPRLPSLRHTVEQWRDPGNIPEAIDDIHNIKTKPFPVFLAVYANGDWSCNNYRSADDIKAGCLPNLVAQMKLWSKGGLTTGEIKAIRVDSPELLTDPPPFIFFTGHRDFVLTDAEIENLQKYLNAGGAIWGDSAFAGDGSRFDVAFHREMKRVLPDADKNFEPLALSHEIFTHSYYPLSKVAVGMNFRADPIEVINLDGKLAVIYTPNDYSDMMTLLLKPGTETPEVDGTVPTLSHPLFTPPGFMNSRNYFYRNYDPQSAFDVYRLSTNIVVHLLTRFDKELELGH